MLVRAGLVVSLLAMAMPAVATKGTTEHHDFPAAMGIIGDRSGAERLYPLSPISDESWQALSAVMRIDADMIDGRPGVQRQAQPDNHAS